MRPGKKDNSLATLTIVIPHPMLQHHPTPQRGVVTSCDTPTARLTSTHTTRTALPPRQRWAYNNHCPRSSKPLISYSSQPPRG